MDTPSLTAFLAAGPGFPSSIFIPTAAHDGSSRYWGKRHGALLHPRPLSRTRLCTMQDFSSSAYWNKLYSGGDVSAKEAVTEWHVNGEALIAPLERLLGSPSASEELAILNVGCGTSTLWARYEGLRGLYDHGWENITNIDFSEACIEQGRPQSADRPGVRWLMMDACSLTFEDATFDVAVDKGTLDAIACSEGFDWLLPRMAQSIVRVLRPGGTWVCVSFTPPELVLPLLECSEWRVEVDALQSFWMYVGKKYTSLGSGATSSV